MNVLKKISSSVLIAGLIILVIGLYYLVIKAGIPYQDPTPELQIQYTVNMKIGEILSGLGFCMSIVAGICRIVLGIIGKKKK